MPLIALIPSLSLSSPWAAQITKEYVSLVEQAAADGFNATACVQGMRSQKDAVMALVTEAAEAHWNNLQARLCAISRDALLLRCPCRAAAAPLLQPAGWMMMPCCSLAQCSQALPCVARVAAQTGKHKLCVPPFSHAGRHQQGEGGGD